MENNILEYYRVADEAYAEFRIAADKYFEYPEMHRLEYIDAEKKYNNAVANARAKYGVHNGE